MERFLQYFFDGLSQGSIYAFVALGLVIIYRGSGHLNFAQGEMAMFSAFIAWWLADNGVGLWPAVAALGRDRLRRGHGRRALHHPPDRPQEPVRGGRGSHRAVPGVQRAGALHMEGHDPRGVRFAVPERCPTTSCASGARSGATRTSACSPCWGSRRSSSTCSSSARSSAWPCGPWPPTRSRRLWSASGPDRCWRCHGVWPPRSVRSGAASSASLRGNVDASMMFTIFFAATAAATLGRLRQPVRRGVRRTGAGRLREHDGRLLPDFIGQELKVVMSLVVILGVLLVKPSGLFGTERVERV